MRRLVFWVSASAAVLATFGIGACGVGTDCDFGMCDGPRVGTDGDGAQPGDGGNEAAPTDECLAKPDAPECLDETKAFFVSSATGDDATGDGTKAKPFKTLATVLGKVTEAKRRIYVCEGTYAEDVVLEASHAGVSLFGGFACDWTKSQSPNKPKFGNGTTALKIAGATGIAIADLAFEAKDATVPGGSSIAAFVANSEVSFKGVSLSAGKGSKGADGVLTTFDFPSAAQLNGKNGDPPGNGAEVLVPCPGGAQTKGGRGGPVGGFDGESGTPGAENKGVVGSCATVGTGRDGDAGAAPSNADGAAVLGELVAEGWIPRAGLDGSNGGPGQGGGGGASAGGGVGGSGGAGGCGGAGGGGGNGGGASIAFASLQSTVRMEVSTLASTTAGDGANGADGQPGQTPGGFGGNPSNATSSCKGGNGGPGGKGAAGGGGAGGISAGVLYKGTQPDLDAATAGSIVTGQKGARGAGPGNPGIDGVSAPTLKIE